MRNIALVLLVLLGIGFLVAQVPGQRTAYIWVKDGLGHHFVPLTAGVTVAADGKSASIAPGQLYTFGGGFVTVTPEGGATQVSLDTAYVLYRTQPPTAPGACTTGTGAIAAGTDGYMYLCVPDGTGQGFKWARSPMETSW